MYKYEPSIVSSGAAAEKETILIFKNTFYSWKELVFTVLFILSEALYLIDIYKGTLISFLLFNKKKAKPVFGFVWEK